MRIPRKITHIILQELYLAGKELSYKEIRERTGLQPHQVIMACYKLSHYNIIKKRNESEEHPSILGRAFHRNAYVKINEKRIHDIKYRLERSDGV